MNKKAFTLIELLAVIIILGIILTIANAFYNSYLVKSRSRAFKIAETSLTNAAREVNTSCVIHNKSCGIVEKGKTVTLGTLVDMGVIDEIINPYNTEEKCSMDSYVYVKDEIIIDEGNKEFDYEVCLICGSNRSEVCK